ncbi:MAG: S8 family serine peptidase [Bacilli bacterium]|nr:S8 family serine peptidase [Bacilli bacterium]
MKMFKYLIGIMIFTMLICLFCLSNVKAFSEKNEIVSTAFHINENEVETIVDENEYSEERVLVLLKHEYSIIDKEYSTEDFSEIDITTIEVLSRGIEHVIKTQDKDNMLINPENYKTVLCLTLSNPSKINVLRAINILNEREDIESAEVDAIIHPESTNPDDYYYQEGLQWNLNGWAGINAPDAWEFTSGCASVLVGVIDSGIESMHPDLVNRVNTTLSRDFSLDYPYIPSAVIDSNDDSHGTKMAGIIGAQGNNEIGITGVCQNVQLVSLKIYDDHNNNPDQDTFASRLVMAIDYASSNGIKILNCSNGVSNYSGTLYPYNTVQSIIQNYPGIFVASAGNNNKDTDVYDHFPSVIRLPNLISVGAHDHENARRSDSNYGETTVDIFAPGGSTYTPLSDHILTTFKLATWTYLEDGYYYTGGTSPATAHVSGVAALLLSIDPNLTGTQMKTAIMNSAVLPDMSGVNPLEGLCVSNGKLDAYGAVKYALTNYVATSYSLSSNMSMLNTSQTVQSDNDYFINDNGFYKLNVSSSTQYDFNVSSSYPIDVLLYDSNYNQLTYTDLNNSSSIVKFNKSLLSGTYYLRVKYQSSTQSGTINTQIKHNHSYTDHYVWKNLTEHKSYCACGEYTTSFHIVSPGAFQSGLLTAPCLLCNGPASFGGIIHDGIGGFPYTLNGSFILPNGVIVLVDEDFEAYMDGTLVFINPNENIDRSNTFIPCIIKKDDDE